MSGSLTLDRRVTQQEVSETKPKGKKEELGRSNGRSKSTFNSSPDVIDVIGNAPWGTHLCQFYRTKENLFDILVPYFKAGLEKNEFCMWVTSEPVDEKEAREVMRGAVPGFDQYLKTGQINLDPTHPRRLQTQDRCPLDRRGEVTLRGIRRIGIRLS